VSDELPARPLPTISPRMQPFWDAARQHRLLIQRCADCERHQFPAVEHCPGCLGPNLRWVEASGRATLFSYVVMHQAHDPYFATKTPYAVVDVRLEEGPHVTSSVIDSPPEALRIGMELKVTFEEVSEALALPVFERASDR
jgi:uncharacterized OB-fold protein